jgi:hypothetical protein
MAGEIRAIGPSGRTCYVHILNANGQRWNGSEFETFAVANYEDYDVSVTEDGSTGIYKGDFPTSIAAGRYDIVLFIRSGATPANGDKAVGSQSLSWSGSSTTPETTPLGALTGSQMRAYIIRSGFRRTDMDDEIYDAMTDTVMEMEQAFRFDERETESSTTDSITVDGDYKLTQQTDFGHIVTLVMVDDNYAVPLDRISKAAYDLLYPNPTGGDYTGYPKNYALFAGQVYIGPIPDRTTYSYRMAYSQRLTSVINAATDPVPFSSQYREVLKDGCLRRLFKNLKNWDLAERFGQDYGFGLDRIITKERRNRGSQGPTSYFDC